MTRDDSEDPVAAGLSLLDQLISVGDVTTEARIDRLTASARLSSLSPEMLEQLLGAAEHGHIVEFGFAAEMWSLTVRSERGVPASLTENGDSAVALSDTDLAAYTAAVARNDVASAVRIAAASVPVNLTFEIVNDAVSAGHHWIRSAGDFHRLLTGPEWVTTSKEICTGPPRVLIGDAGDAQMRTEMLDIHGPYATVQRSPAGAPPAASTAAGNHNPDLPPPHLSARPHFIGGSSAIPVALNEDFHALTRRLVWARLASAAELNSDGVLTVTLSGARIVSFDIRPEGSRTASDADLDLYDWTFSTDDIARYDSTVYAASLAISNGADLQSAAKPTLRTARSLYNLTKSGAVAEALATRRAAREAVQDSARIAAATARETSGKATERCVLQAGAAVAVVLTNAARLVSDRNAISLLIAIAVLSALSLVVALVVELKSGRDALSGSLADLDQYRETMPDEDINDIRTGRAATAAGNDLKRATLWTAVVYGATAIAVLVVGILQVNGGE